MKEGRGGDGIDCLRLATHWKSRASGKISIDWTNLFGDVGEGFLEELVALVADIFKVFFCFLGAATSVFEFFFRGLEPAFYALEAFEHAHVWSHLIELAT